MNSRQFKTGEQVDAISTAGEPFTRYEHLGISADVFERPDDYVIPMIQSRTPGSGNLDAFLDALRAELPTKPVHFTNVINRRLADHLTRRGFEIVEIAGEEEWEAEMMRLAGVDGL